MVKSILSIYVYTILVGCRMYMKTQYNLLNIVSGVAAKKLLITAIIGLMPVLAFSQPNFSASFTQSTIGPGSVSKLLFTIDNTGGGAVNNLSFTNTLPAGLTVATTSAATGILNAPAGGSTITYSLDRMAADGVITIEVYVTGSTPGVYTNVSGDLTSSSGNSGTASADLTISAAIPGFTKSFSPAVVNIGERSTLTFTIDNSANGSGIASLTFTDNLPPGMVIASPANASTTCSSSLSPLTLTADSGSDAISFTAPGFDFDGFRALEAGATCSISVDVIGQSSGQLNNLTSELQAGFNSGKASATLEVRTPTTISLQKRFVTNPALPGGTTDLEYTITNFDRSNAATNITFTDDLGAALSGLEATGLPLNDICGAGSQISGTTLLTLTGGNLAPGESRTLSVPLQVPVGAAWGSYASTSNAITGDIGGIPVTGNTATEKLFIANYPTFTKTFLSNPITAGGTTIVEFTITNTSATSALTDLAFSDIADDFIGGSVFSSPPAADACGAGSSFFATPTGFQMTGGSIPADGSCTFTVDLTVPTNLSSGTYTYTTNNLTGTTDSGNFTEISASDELTVLAVPRITKTFINAPVNAGEIVNLEYTITYDELATGDATNISFTDNLDAVIPGLSALGLPLSTCGGSISGTTSLTLTSGTLAPGGTCTFVIPVQVPAGISPGSYPSTSSNLTATVGGQSATGSTAAADLVIGGLNFTKEFINDPAIPGGLVTLRYTIENTTAFDATNIIFTDNLSSALSGMAAEAPLPTGADICNGNLFGTNSLVYTGGTVLAGTTCTFDVLVRVPAGAAPSVYISNSSNLTATMDGRSVTVLPANDQLTVENNLIRLEDVLEL